MLLTKENRKALPPLYANENLKDPEAIVKFFTPDGNFTWYAMEFDGEDLFFGFVDGYEKELGYFSLKELSSLRGAFNLPVERDMYFKPTKLSELRGDNVAA